MQIMEWHELCEIYERCQIVELVNLWFGLSLETSKILVCLGEHQRTLGRTAGLGEHQWEYPEIETRWHEFLEGSSILVCLGEYQRTPGRTPGLGEHQWECLDIEMMMSWIVRLGEHQRTPGRTPVWKYVDENRKEKYDECKMRFESTSHSCIVVWFIVW